MGNRHREYELLLAGLGRGPLLRRDYWAVIRNCRHSPAELIRTVRRHLTAFAPSELVTFRLADGADREIRLGDEVDVHILGAGDCRVRVIHLDDRSFTLATEEGHPEAGRITFGAYRNRRGDVIFHIRSHARSSTRSRRAGFLGIGEVMQTSTWTEFVDRVAVGFGEGPIGYVRAETTPLRDESAEAMRSTPTYLAAGS